MHPYFFLTDDLLFQAVASQSPIFPAASAHYLYNASNAIDRNTSTCMRTDEIGTNSPQKNMWWKVDLGTAYGIYSIDILFKNYKDEGKYLFDCTNFKTCF